jgi:hypothetical protein
MASDMPTMLSIAAGTINEAAKYDSSEMRNREVGGKKNATGSKKKQVTMGGTSFMEDYFKSKVAETPHQRKQADDVARSMAGISTGINMAAKMATMKFVVDEKNTREKQLASICERKGYNVDDVMFAEDDAAVKKVLGGITDSNRALYNCWKIVTKFRTRFEELLESSKTAKDNFRMDSASAVPGRKRKYRQRDDASCNSEGVSVTSPHEYEQSDNEMEDYMSDSLPKAPFKQIETPIKSNDDGQVNAANAGADDDENDVAQGDIEFTQSEEV